jgi:hypothetical protein
MNIEAPMNSWLAPSLRLLLGAALLAGCKQVDDTLGDAEDTVDDVVSSEVTGRVEDDRGEPVAGVRVRIYDLLDNTHFVEGSDIGSAEAYIDREAVLESDNDVGDARTGEDGRFVIEDVTPSAFLAVATHEACAAGFAGFDDETGVLNLDTLITPSFDDGLRFPIPGFVLACATAPEVGPDGNSEEAPPVDPELPIVTCDEDSCAAAGGACEGEACVLTCTAASCGASGGSCVDGECVLPACDSSACGDLGGLCDGDTCVVAACDTATCGAARGTCSADANACNIPPCFAAEADCTSAGGACSADGAICELPVCSADEDCQAAQPGAYCSHPGDVELARCEPPEPAEIVPPVEALGWTALLVTDADGDVLADAGSDNQRIAAGDLPEDGVVRIHGGYDGSATTAFIQLQSGGQSCPNLPPRTDFIAVDLVDGELASERGAYVELVLHGGYQKLQLSTSDVLGDGESSYVVEIGEPCTPPTHPFVATLSWDAGPGQPADLDLVVWNGDGELVFVGKKQAAWGRLALEGKGPGPEVFEATDTAQGPFTVKVQFFSGKPRDIEGKLRIQRTVDGQLRDETFGFIVSRPKDVAVIGVFAAE